MENIFALVLVSWIGDAEMVVVLDDNLTAAACEYKANDVEEVLILGVGEGFILACETQTNWSE
jgi:hypothetical protein